MGFHVSLGECKSLGFRAPEIEQESKSLNAQEWGANPCSSPYNYHSFL